MEKFNPEQYRKQLASDLKGVEDHEERSEMLESEQGSVRYQKAKEKHVEDVQLDIEKRSALKEFDTLVESKELESSPEQESWLLIKEAKEARLYESSELIVNLQAILAYKDLGVDDKYLLAMLRDYKKSIVREVENRFYHGVGYETDYRGELFQVLWKVCSRLNLDPTAEFGLESKPQKKNFNYEDPLKKISDDELVTQINDSVSKIGEVEGYRDRTMPDVYKSELRFLLKEKFLRTGTLDKEEYELLADQPWKLKDLFDLVLKKGDVKLANELLSKLVLSKHVPFIIESFSALALHEAEAGGDWEQYIEKAKALLGENVRYQDHRHEEDRDHALVLSDGANRYLAMTELKIASLLKSKQS